MKNEKIENRTKQYEEEVLNSPEFMTHQSYLHRVSLDFIWAIQNIAFYSSRASHIYNKQLTNTGFDDLTQSIISIAFQIQNGVHNPAKRELRYILEMAVKYLYVDQKCQGKEIKDKILYLANKKLVDRSGVANSSGLTLPFDKENNDLLISEIKDVFSKLCSFVHPSKEQLDAQIKAFENGEHIGFESVESLEKINKIIFRTYDIILTLLFVGFGQSMSGDLFIEIYDGNKEWKFHKGKYVSKYSSLFDYKAERQK